MFISLCVIAYNEEKYLPRILEDIKNQDYPLDSMEIVLVNSASTDGTKAVMEQFARDNKEYRRVVVLDNPKKTLPCGWNVALAEFKGEAILKVDAHARIPSDFVRKNVEVLMSGEDISGGKRPNVLEEETPWQQTLLLAESSMFGSSIAPYRRNPERKYVNSMFHAAYRREIFEKIGGFNEGLGRTEDNEIHYRMREAGYKLCFDPEIVSWQYIRGSLSKMLKQKFANGYWIGLTTGVCPKCLSLYHFVPFAFVLTIIVSTILCVALGISGGFSTLAGHIIAGLARLFWAVYWSLAIIMAMLAVIGADKIRRNESNVLLPVLFFLLHVSYGLGTLVGFIKLPWFLKKYKAIKVDVRL